MHSLFTLHQASERTGIAHETLRQQARKGVLVAAMLGRQWVVTDEALADYVRDHKGKHGFASAGHPYHGQRVGGRRKKYEGERRVAIKGFTPAQQQQYDAMVRAIIVSGISEDRAGEMALINLGHIPGDTLDLDTEEGRAAWALLTGADRLVME